MLVGQSICPPRIRSLYGGGDMKKRKKSRLRIGKVTYGTRDPLEAFTAAFAPYFASTPKQEPLKKVQNG